MTFRVIACAAASFLALSPMAAPEAKALSFLTTIEFTAQVYDNMDQEVAQPWPRVELFWTIKDASLAKPTLTGADIDEFSMFIARGASILANIDIMDNGVGEVGYGFPQFSARRRSDLSLGYYQTGDVFAGCFSCTADPDWTGTVWTLAVLGANTSADTGLGAPYSIAIEYHTKGIGSNAYYADGVLTDYSPVGVLSTRAVADNYPSTVSAAVPAPPAGALLAAALIGLGALRRRARRN